MRETDLLKAISDMEAIAKGESVSPGMSGKGNDIPRTTSQANGGLSSEGDQQELSVSATSPTFAAKGEGMDDEEFDDLDNELSLADWAQDDAIKGEEEDESMEDSESDSEEDESSESDEDEDDEGGEEPPKKGKMMAKKGQTLSDLMKSDTSTGPVMDVAPFLERLVDQLSDSIESQNQAIAEISQRMGSQQRVLKTLGNVSLNIQKAMAGLGEQPSGGRRSVLSKSEMIDRFEEEVPDFSKADVLDAMVDLCQKGQVDPVAVSRYEATNTMEPEIRKSVEGYLLSKSA